MNTKKPLIALSALTLLIIAALPSALAAMDPFSSLGGLLQSVVSVLFRFFNLSYLGLDLVENKVAFMRLMVWIISFAIFNVATRVALGGKGGGSGLMSVQGGQKLPVIISICLATISAVFIPASVLLAIGIQYSAVWAAILLMALFAGMLYVAYGMIKPEKAMGHIIRLAILFVCWMLLLNFTAVVDNPSYSPSMSTSDFTFNNTVLGFVWELLSVVVGILIIYEIMQIFKKSAASTVGNAGTHLSNTANWVDNTKHGWNDLKDSFKAEEDIEKDEERALNQIGVDDSRESTAADRAIKFSSTLHKKLMDIINYLTILQTEVNEGRTDSKKFASDIDKVVKNLGSTLTTLTSKFSAEEWAYKIVHQEMDLVGKMHGLITGQNNLLEAITGKINSMPKSPKKDELMKKVKDLNGLVDTFSKDEEKLANFCKEKAQRIYNDIRPVHYSMSQLKAAAASLNELKRSDAAAISSHLSALIKKLQETLETLKRGEEFMSVFYTMNRDERNIIKTKFKGDLEHIKRELIELERDYNAVSVASAASAASANPAKSK